LDRIKGLLEAFNCKAYTKLLYFVECLLLCKPRVA